MQCKMFSCNNITTLLEMQKFRFRIQIKVDSRLIMSNRDVREDKIFCSLSRNLWSHTKNKTEPIIEV